MQQNLFNFSINNLRKYKQVSACLQIKEKIYFFNHFSNQEDPKNIFLNTTNNVLYIILVEEIIENLIYFFKETENDKLLIQLDNFLYKSIKDPLQNQNNPFFRYEKYTLLDSDIYGIVKFLESNKKPCDNIIILPFYNKDKTKFEYFFRYE